MTPEEKEELQRLIKIEKRLQALKEEQAESQAELKDVHQKIAEHLKKDKQSSKE